MFNKDEKSTLHYIERHVTHTVFHSFSQRNRLRSFPAIGGVCVSICDIRMYECMW